MYSITPKSCISFFAYEYQKYAEFYAESVEIIGKKCAQKKVIGQKIWQVSSIGEGKL
jgi:hypothetical protein